MKEAPKITGTALAMTYHAHQATGEDPRITFVTCMTAAAISGHMLSRTREQMHETLDQVFDAAQAAVLHVTETKQ